MNKLIASLWMLSAAIFAGGVFLMAQSSIAPVGPAEAARQIERHAEAAEKAEGSSSIARSAAAHGLQETEQPEESGDAAVADNGNPVPPLPAKKKDGPAKWMIVADTDGVMRSAPEAEAPMLFGFPVGRKLNVVEEKGDWAKVEDAESGATGWMAASQLAEPGERVAALERRQGADVRRNRDDLEDAWKAEIARQAEHVSRRMGPVGNLLRQALRGL